jgi:hypothetical protein
MSEPFVIAAVGLDFEAKLARTDSAAKVCCGRGSEMAVALATCSRARTWCTRRCWASTSR